MVDIFSARERASVQGIVCPIYRYPARDFHVEDSDLRPLLERIQQRSASGEGGGAASPSAGAGMRERFPRGTLEMDGRLDLCKQAIGAEGTARVVQALLDAHQASGVRSLLLGTNALRNEGAHHVARLIAGDASITSVYLGCNDIQHEGVRALADAIAGSRTVQALWLKRNPVGVLGAQHLAGMLRVNSVLQTLDLVNTGIGNVGLGRVVDALLDRPVPLLRLHVGGNGTDEQGAEHLARLLRSPACPSSLTVAVSRLGDAGALTVARALPHAARLLELSLASGGIGTEGVAALLMACEHTRALLRLDLGVARSTTALGGQRNRGGDACVPFVAALARANPSLTALNLAGNGITDVSELLDALRTNRRLRVLRVGRRVPAMQRRALRALTVRRVAVAPADRTALLALEPHVRAIASSYRTLPPGAARLTAGRDTDAPDAHADDDDGLVPPAPSAAAVLLTPDRAARLSAAEFGRWLAAREAVPWGWAGPPSGHTDLDSDEDGDDLDDAEDGALSGAGDGGAGRDGGVAGPLDVFAVAEKTG